jgi:hypothetical protein
MDNAIIVSGMGAFVFNLITGTVTFYPEKGGEPIPVKGLDRDVKAVAAAASILAATEGMKEYGAVRREAIKNLLSSAKAIETTARPFMR